MIHSKICALHFILLSIYIPVYSFDWPTFQTSSAKQPEWTGKWFPQPPGKVIDDNPTVDYQPKREQLFDNKHGIQMGVLSSDCDDGKTNLTLDWDGSPLNYTCYEDKYSYLPNYEINPVLTCDNIPKGYSAIHKCMDTPIHYDENIPTFGTHRPLWAKYGEYAFLPKQRWLHNLEHGTIVMIYHPCAEKNEVELLKNIVKGCLYRHIITPYNLLSPERPLALLSWGCRLLMSKVDSDLAMRFIRKAALHGPENVHRNGQFEFGLLEDAAVVSNIEDSVLCPNFVISSMK